MSRILVIDDEIAERESLARLFTAAGHDAVTAADGRDAWLTLYEGAPDLILLDLMMPQMDGVTFLRLLRHSDHWYRVPVIVLTGAADNDGLVVQARDLGVVAVLQKMSCDVPQLLALVERTLATPATPLQSAPVRQRARRSLACGVA